MKAEGKYHPPTWPIRFFRWFCKPEMLEDIEGDLVEEFNRNARGNGIKKAKWKFTTQVIRLFRPGIIKAMDFSKLLKWNIMFKHNLKISWRILRKSKGFSGINIFGLAMGMLLAMFIALWILDEMSFDQFHQDNILQVKRNVYSGDDIRTSSTVTYNIAEVLRDQYPEIEKVAVTTNPINLVFYRDQLSFRERGYYADPEFFEIFAWKIITGTKDNLLLSPNSIVISTSFADKYFGENWDEKNIVGKTIQQHQENLGDLVVTGVFADIPDNSSLQFDFVLPMQVFVQQNDWVQNWNNSGLAIFAKTKADIASLNPRIVDIQNEHIDQFRSDLFFQKYSDIYLHSNFSNGKINGGRIEYVRIFSVIALAIILIACINFINLSIARSMNRAREIGVRKAVGANKNSLIHQFMTESLLLVVSSFVVAISALALILPYFNQLTGKSIHLQTLPWQTWITFLGIGVLTAIIAGSYPSFYLSSLRIIEVLRGKLKQSDNKLNSRKGLIVFQFTISILLIIGTLTIYRQMKYIHSKNLGLDRENVLIVPSRGEIVNKYKIAKEELLQQPGIAAVSTANSNPMSVGSNTHSVQWPGKDPNSQISMNILAVNYDFLEVMKMELIEGRDFHIENRMDSANYLVNETAAKTMGMENPLGQQLSFWNNTGQIIGVLKDFHMSSLYDQINPTILILRPNWMPDMYIRTQPGQTQEAIDGLSKVYKELNPGYPFEYQFMDESFAQMYHSEQLIGELTFVFSFCALFIACLGLFGLAIFNGQQRLKEISIRKILGAKTGHIVYLLSRDFISLILLAFIFAAPVSYLLMNKWLSKFAYHTHLQLGLFLFAGTATIIVALLIVGSYGIKIAFVNPMKNLRQD